MRVAMLHDYLDVRIEEMPIPEPGPGEALVRARACGVCSGDVVPWYIRKKAPLVFGHEPVGEIVAVGDRAALPVGTRVFVHHHAPCLRCRACLRQHFVQCSEWRTMQIAPGGMAEYFLVRAAGLAHDTLALPAGVADADGALVEPTACVVKSLERAGQVRDASVLVIGLGVMGQLHVLLARHFGARQIIAADLVEARCAKARALGADAIVDASRENLVRAVADLTAGDGCEIVIAGPATTDALQLGLDCAARGGTVVQFMGTPPGTHLKLDTNALYFKEITLVPSYSCGPTDTQAALDLIRDGVVRAAHVVTHQFDLKDAALAYRTAAEDRTAIKVMVTFSGGDPVA